MYPLKLVTTSRSPRSCCVKYKFVISTVGCGRQCSLTLKAQALDLKWLWLKPGSTIYLLGDLSKLLNIFEIQFAYLHFSEGSGSTFLGQFCENSMWKCLLIQALFCSTLFIRNLYWSVFIITISILCFIVCFKFIFETLLYSALKIQPNAIILEIPQEEQHFFSSSYIFWLPVSRSLS